MVFDTAQLGEMLAEEADAHLYGQLNIAAVTYAGQGLTVEQLFPEVLDNFEKFIVDVVENPSEPPNIEVGFAPFVSSATMYKHQGVREECEVRIAALPGKDSLLRKILAKHPKYEPASVKLVQCILRRERSRRYISLFERVKRPLPIKRIIVGPSQSQEANAELARRLVGDGAHVVRSDTPYIG